jgi:hypothetical protein
MKRRLPRNLSPAAQRARVLQELDQVIQGDTQENNLIEEQLRQCPEAFEVGKMVEKLCDSLKYDRQGGARLLPPAGVVIPPIV